MFFEAEIIEARQSPDIADWHEVIGPDPNTDSRRDDIPRTPATVDDAEPEEGPESMKRNPGSLW